MAVNELMLCETFMALYFLVGVGITYLVLALLLHTSERHRLRRRNIWLRDNRPEHDWAYLLTIKTGTQWNAGTTSKVRLMRTSDAIERETGQPIISAAYWLVRFDGKVLVQMETACLHIFVIKYIFKSPVMCDWLIKYHFIKFFMNICALISSIHTYYMSKLP